MNKKPCFKASVRNDGALEMLVYQDIGPGDNAVSATAVKQQLDQTGYDKIVVRINSPGGDAFEGIAIHNLIRAQKKPVETVIDGIAASSASIIAMAGDTITMGVSSMMMIHDAWSVAVGNAAELRKMADTLEKVSSSIAQTYADRTRHSLARIKEWMDSETWMSAQDCLDNGFATAIVGDDKAAMALAKTFKIRAKSIPAKLQASPSCECACENCTVDNCPECSNADCVDQNCTDCPNQNVAASNLSQYEARLTLLTL